MVASSGYSTTKNYESGQAEPPLPPCIIVYSLHVRDKNMKGCEEKNMTGSRRGSKG